MNIERDDPPCRYPGCRRTRNTHVGVDHGFVLLREIMTTPFTQELADEMFQSLFTIVRQSELQGYPGHDAMLKARSIIRRLAPDAYADIMRRKERAGGKAAVGPKCPIMTAEKRGL